MTVSETQPDADTAGRIRAGDAAAFEAVFREYYAGLCDFAAAILLAPDVAEEVVQDVFANIWRSRESLSVATTLRAYLFGAVRNRCLNERHRAARELTDADARLAATPAAAPDALRMAEQNEVGERVRNALDSLPPRCREVLSLRWLHGLSHAEIAGSLGITTKSVENHLARGHAALRLLL